MQVMQKPPSSRVYFFRLNISCGTSVRRHSDDPKSTSIELNKKEGCLSRFADQESRIPTSNAFIVVAWAIATGFLAIATLIAARCWSLSVDVSTSIATSAWMALASGIFWAASAGMPKRYPSWAAALNFVAAVLATATGILLLR